MLSVQNVSKKYGEQQILTDVSLEINKKIPYGELATGDFFIN